MNVTLIFASSINGYIAEKDHSVHWSSEVWKAYQSISHEKWNMIVWRFTYDLMLQTWEIDTLGLRNLIIVSHNPWEGNYITKSSPKEALQYLESLWEEEVIICGGSSIASHLFQNNLLNEIIIDIEPIVISWGIPMFWDLSHIPKIKLTDMKILGTQTVRLHYSIIP